MAILWFDGFEFGTVQNWNLFVSTVTANATPPSGMTGSYYGNMGSSSGIGRTLESNETEVHVAWRVNPNNANVTHILKFWDEDGTVLFTLGRNSTTGYLEARFGDYGTLVATGTHNIAVQATFHIEVHYIPLTSGGTFEVKVDGNDDIDYSGNTTNGHEHVRSVLFTNGSTTAYNRIDDCVIANGSDWIGGLRVQGLGPIGAGSSTQWDPSSGSNYQTVDEAVPSDTDYNYTNVADEVDMFDTATMSGTVTQVLGVVVGVRGFKEGNPTPTKIQVGIRSGGNNYFSSSFEVPTSHSWPYFSKFWMNNPADDAAWEKADVDAIEIGYKAVSS